MTSSSHDNGGNELGSTYLHLEKFSYGMLRIKSLRSLVLMGMTVLFFTTVSSQSTRQFFDEFSVSDGLSNNNVQSIAQDQSGYIWIGTEEGLNRFDGNSFKKFFYSQKDSTGLPGNDVKALYASKEFLWIGVFGQGISRYNYANGTFKNYRLPNAGYSERSSNSIRQIVSLNEQVFVTTNSGFYFYNKELDSFTLIDDSWIGLPDFPYQFRLNVLPDPDRQGLWIQMRQLWFLKMPDKTVYHQGYNPENWEIFNDTTMTIPGMDSKGNYWYQDRYDFEIKCYDPTTHKNTRYSNKVWMNVNGSEDLINAIFPDERGGAWIARDRHSNYYLTSEGIADSVAFHFNYPGSIGDCVIRSVYTDREGVQWIGTNKGLYREIQKNGNLRCFGVKIENSKVQEIKNSLLCDDFFYFVEVGILKRISVNTGEVESFEFSSADGVLRPENIAPYDEEYLLILMNDRDFWLFNKSSTQLTSFDCSAELLIQESRMGAMTAALFSTYVDEKGYLWIAEVGSSMIREDLSSGECTFYGESEEGINHLPSDHINAMTILPDSKEIVLGFIAGFGVWRWNESKNQFEDWILGEAGKIIKSTTVNALQFDRKGNLWIGLNGAGILIWNPQDGTYNMLSRYSGLPGEYINRIATVGNESVLVVTNNGACRIDVSTLSIKNILVGFGSSRAGQMVSTLSEYFEENQVWFTFHNYVFQTSFSKVESDSKLPDPSVASFYVFGKELFAGLIPSKIELNYNQNFFTLDITSFFFGKSEEVELSYMLEGYDRDWNMVNSLGQASYTSVPGGDYIFKIRSRQKGGEWGNAISYSINVVPPFWERWWFYGLVIVAIGAIIYAIYRYRLSQIMKLQEVRNKIAHDLHDDVGATLSSINIYSKLALDNIQKNPDDSKLLLSRINRSASGMMDNMSDIVWSINPRNDTLQSLIMRIKAHSSEVLGSMNIHVKFDQQIADDQQLNMQARKNLFLIAKEAVNNIAKHSGAKEVKLNFKTINGYLEMTISDNGNGKLDESTKGGNGMVSMKKRAEELGGSFSVDDKSGEGITLLVKIPLTNIRY